MDMSQLAWYLIGVGASLMLYRIIFTRWLVIAILAVGSAYAQDFPPLNEPQSPAPVFLPVNGPMPPTTETCNVVLNGSNWVFVANNSLTGSVSSDVSRASELTLSYFGDYTNLADQTGGLVIGAFSNTAFRAMSRTNGLTGFATSPTAFNGDFEISHLGGTLSFDFTKTKIIKTFGPWIRALIFAVLWYMTLDWVVAYLFETEMRGLQQTSQLAAPQVNVHGYSVGWAISTVYVSIVVGLFLAGGAATAVGIANIENLRPLNTGDFSTLPAADPGADSLFTPGAGWGWGSQPPMSSPSVNQADDSVSSRSFSVLGMAGRLVNAVFPVAAALGLYISAGLALMSRQLIFVAAGVVHKLLVR